MQRLAFNVAQPRATALRALNYSPDIETLRATEGRSARLGDLIAELGPAYGTVFTRLDCSEEHGIELLSQSDMFSSEPSGRVIRRDSMAKPERHFVRRWQLLIAGAGTLGENELYGRCIIADGRLAGKYVGPDALSLTFRDEGGDLNLYCYAFLASALGVQALRSASYGTKILRIRSDVLADLPVPLPDEQTIARVAALVREVVEQRERYIAALNAARLVIDELPEMQEAHAMCATRRARCISWSEKLPSLCAWNYASTGGALRFLRSKWSTRIRDLTGEGGVYAGKRFARHACTAPHGIDLASQRDVFMIRRFPRRVVRPALPDELLFCPSHCLLVACDGQFSEGSLFGKVELAANGLTDCGVTQHIMRLMVPQDRAAFVYAYLSTRVGHRLLKSTAVGTSVPTMRVDLVESLPVPSVDQRTIERTNHHVGHAIAARTAAEAAESDAIEILEQQVLTQWLG